MDKLRFVLFVSIVAVILNKVESTVQCDGPWEKIHRACYIFIEEYLTWPEAQQKCAQNGGLLVSINSLAERKKLMRKMRSKITKGGMEKWWVGLSFNTTKAKWRWEDGEELNIRVTPWGPGEPNNGRGRRNEFCSVVNFQPKLYDEYCENYKYSICEMNKITPAPTSTTTTKPLTTTSSTTTTASTTTTITTTSTTAIPTTTKVTPSTTTRTPTTSSVIITSDPTTSTMETKLTSSDFFKPLTNYDVVTRSNGRGRFSTKPTRPTNRVLKDNNPKPTGIPKPAYRVTHCPPRLAFGFMWPRTKAGQMVSKPCREGKGVTTWTCRKRPVRWTVEPDTTACVSSKYKSLIQRFQVIAMKKEIEASEAIDMTSALVGKTASEDQLSTADISASTKIIKMVKMVKPKSPAEAKVLVKEVIKAGSNLMKKTKISKAVPKQDKKRMATSLLEAIEDSSKAMAEAIDEPAIIKTKSEKIELELHVVNTSSVTKELVYGGETSEETFSIPMSALKEFSSDGLTKVVFMTHYDIGQFLTSDDEDSDDIDEQGNEERHQRVEIGSNIISASLGTNKTIRLQEPVVFTLKLLQPKDDKTEAVCSFWNFSKGESGDWAQDGCGLLFSNESHCSCQCNHLTNFAILFDVTGVQLSVTHTTALQYITCIGCIISIIALFTSWLTFICLSPLQSERNSIHKNLVFCLMAAELIFLIGIKQTDKPVACASIALLLHFFFLSAFTWMFMEAIHIVVMLVQVFDTAKSILKYYYLSAYGAPVVIVAVTAGIDFTAYGTDQYCWLTTERWFIWSFAGPVAVILLFNATVLTFAMVSVCRHSEYVFSREKSQTGNFKSWIQGALALEVLLGLTWVFGYFFINEETVVMAYIFAIFNSLQGFFIFIFHCLLNKKVRNEYSNLVHMRQQRRLSRTLSSTKSASVRKNDGSYELYVPAS